MRKHIWKRLMAVVTALVVASFGMPASTVPIASAEPAPEAAEPPPPLPTCAEAGSGDFFCDTHKPDWYCYEGETEVWFQDACNSETPGCD